MVSTIFAMDEKTGEIRRKATYTLEPSKALVCYIVQAVKNDYNTWKYPDHIEGMRESTKAKNHWYYDDIDGGRVLAAYPA